MKYFLSLLPRPFDAIKIGIKTIEGRAQKDANDHRYEQMKIGDEIIFENEETHEKIIVSVQFVRHYKTIKEMLEKEGVENVLSSKGTIEQGIESYNSLGNYKERIKKFGIYAIGVKVI